MAIEKDIQITFRVKASDVFRLKDKVEMFEAFSRLDAENQKNMTEIMKNPKALKAIADNKVMLQSLFL